ncbi:hypothetical protein HK102_013471 [Quaeritorhiza haematococci]|nr:hypothetical protein HK102_013471 [Quaeritorhiza haematococci]
MKGRVGGFSAAEDGEEYTENLQKKGRGIGVFHSSATIDVAAVVELVGNGISAAASKDWLLCFCFEGIERARDATAEAKGSLVALWWLSNWREGRPAPITLRLAYDGKTILPSDSSSAIHDKSLEDGAVDPEDKEGMDDVDDVENREEVDDPKLNRRGALIPSPLQPDSVEPVELVRGFECDSTAYWTASSEMMLSDLSSRTLLDRE